jgi:hypothetical protein
MGLCYLLWSLCTEWTDYRSRWTKQRPSVRTKKSLRQVTAGSRRHARRVGAAGRRSGWAWGVGAAAQRSPGCAGLSPVPCLGAPAAAAPSRTVLTSGQGGWRPRQRAVGSAEAFPGKVVTACGYTVHALCAAAGPGRAARQPEPGRWVKSGNLATKDSVFQDRAAHGAFRPIRLAKGRAIPRGFTRPGHTACRIPVEPVKAQLSCRYRERRSYDG